MPAVTTIRTTLSAACWLVVLAVTAGCSNGPATGTVSGTVKVDGQTPAVGSSITFMPVDGTSPTAGAVIEQGRYSVQVPTGKSKVEIRVPRPSGAAAGDADGPGGASGLIEESLPAKYNDQTELTLEVTRGKNEKDWDLSTKSP